MPVIRRGIRIEEASPARALGRMSDHKEHQHLLKEGAGMRDDETTR
jgi:hypothetical protein